MGNKCIYRGISERQVKTESFFLNDGMTKVCSIVRYSIEITIRDGFGRKNKHTNKRINF